MRFRLCVVLVLVGLVGSASAQTDRDALIALYNSTAGENWADNTNWNTEEDISTWFGVTVTDARVTALRMRGNNLTGTLPPEIGNLSAMVRLELRGNNLTGSIPDEIGNLTAMVRLDLRENGLTGPIPSTLQQLPDLAALYLRVNSLSGSVPGWLPELGNLRLLDLSQNALTGPIPADIGRLSLLNQFWLNDNPISGEVPPSVGSMTVLQSARFSDTGLSGPLPRTVLQIPTCATEDRCGGAGLHTFTFNSSELCAPADDEFTAWLEGIFNAAGPRCAAVPALPGLAHVLMSLVLAGLGAIGIRRRAPRVCADGR